MTTAVALDILQTLLGKPVAGSDVAPTPVGASLSVTIEAMTIIVNQYAKGGDASGVDPSAQSP
jgi:hypothetical protein